MIQLLNIIPTQLLPALGIPLVELFPDLCLGWWTPPSLNLDEYNRRSFLRILLQIIAWYPVSQTIATDPADSSEHLCTFYFGLLLWLHKCSVRKLLHCTCLDCSCSETPKSLRTHGDAETDQSARNEHRSE